MSQSWHAELETRNFHSARQNIHNILYSNLVIMDTKGTGVTVHVIEVSLFWEVRFISISVSQGPSKLSINYPYQTSLLRTPRAGTGIILSII